MKELTAYQCADGSLYEDEKKALAHDDDLLGQELDGLLRLFGLDITRNQEYSGILAAMKRRGEVLTACQLIMNILEHSI